MEKLILNNDIEKPIMGFGTYQIPSRMTQACVEQALRVGYRAVDTAQCYGNEEQVGRAIAASRLSREDVFVTTKTWTNGYRSTLVGIERSAALLGGSIDLLLIHEPTSDIEGTWRALEEAYETGKARAIGISNFLGKNLDALLSIASVTPVIDQVETHVFRQQAELQRKLDEQGIVLESWSPLACGRNSIFHNPKLASIGQAHNKSAVQVALRWLIQRDIPLNVKSTHEEHMRENLDIFDFELTDAEMTEIEALDTGRSQFGWW